MEIEVKEPALKILENALIEAERSFKKLGKKMQLEDKMSWEGSKQHYRNLCYRELINSSIKDGDTKSLSYLENNCPEQKKAREEYQELMQKIVENEIEIFLHDNSKYEGKYEFIKTISSYGCATNRGIRKVIEYVERLKASQEADGKRSLAQRLRDSLVALSEEGEVDEFRLANLELLDLYEGKTKTLSVSAYELLTDIYK